MKINAKKNWFRKNMITILLHLCFFNVQHISACPPNCICKSSYPFRMTREFECISTAFKEIVAAVDPALTVIQIINLNATDIEDDTFSLLPNLRSIFIIAPNVTKIGEHAFRHLWNLTSLNIRRTPFKNITSKMFKGLLKLTTLRLNENNISWIDQNAFHDLKVLRSLSLVDNDLKMIRDFTFSPLAKLEFLSITKNKLSNITSNVFLGLENLQFLYLQENKLENIAENSFAHLKKLKKLELHDNKLKSIDYILSNLTSLQLLSVHTNSLRRLKNNYFDGNLFLLRIFVQHNHISTIDESTFRGDNLIEINLSHNKLRTILNSAFLNCPHLKYLDLSYNDITYIEEDALTANPILVKINLSFNNLTMLHSRENITKSIFERQSNLVSLNLSNNRISSIYPYISSSFKHLRKLYLSNNLLDHFPKDLLDDFKEINCVDIRFNTIPCSCYFLNLLHTYANIVFYADCVKFGNLVNAMKLTCDIQDGWTLYQGNCKNIFDNGHKNRSNEHLGDEFIILFDIKIKQNNFSVPSSKKIPTSVSLFVLFDEYQFLLDVGKFLLAHWNSIEIIQEREDGNFSFSVLMNGRLLHSRNEFPGGNLTFIRVEVFEKDMFYQTKNVKILTKGFSMNTKISTVIHHFLFYHTENGMIKLTNKTHIKIFNLIDNNSTSISSVTYSFDQHLFIYVNVLKKMRITQIMSYNMLTNSSNLIMSLPMVINQLIYNRNRNSLIVITDNDTIKEISLKTKKDSVIYSSEYSKITIDSCNSLIFVADLNRRAIRRIHLNGSNEKVIVPDLINPAALTVDTNISKLYWADTYYGVIGETNYDGSCQKVISFIPNKTILSMTVFDGMIYWVEGILYGGSRIWRTWIRTSQSELVTESQNQIHGIGAYLKESGEPCTTICIEDKQMNNFDIPSYFYPVDLSKSQRLPRGYGNVEAISLSRNLTLCGHYTDTIYVSENGYISTARNQDKNRIVLAVYMSNITTRFTGDVYISENTDLSLRKRILYDAIDKEKSLLLPDWLVIVTWVNIPNVRDGTTRNTFQVIIASNNDKSFTVFYYGHLDEPFGTVGVKSPYTDLRRLENSKLLNGTKLFFRLYREKNQLDSLLRWILFLVLFVSGLIFIIRMAVCLHRVVWKLNLANT